MTWADRQWVGDEARWSICCRHCGHSWEPEPVYVTTDFQHLVLEHAQVMTACPRCRQGVTYQLPLMRG